MVTHTHTHTHMCVCACECAQASYVNVISNLLVVQKKAAHYLHIEKMFRTNDIITRKI